MAMTAPSISDMTQLAVPTEATVFGCSLLAHPQGLSLTQVALMLGYSEQAALTRSCRRWYGCTPSALRVSDAR